MYFLHLTVIDFFIISMFFCLFFFMKDVIPVTISSQFNDAFISQLTI